MKFLLLTVISFAFSLVGCSKSDTQFEAYRFLHYLKGGIPLGSTKSTVNHVAYHLTDLEQTGKDLSRNVAIVRMENLTLELLENIKSRNAPALLVILPADLTQVSPDRLTIWKELEQSLIKEEVNLALWFTFENEILTGIIESLEKNEDRFHLSGNSVPKQVTNVKLTNFLASIRGKGKSASETLKNIVIASNYDTFASVPALAFGINDNASGVVALIQTASIFHRLYKEESTKGPFNILFLVTGAGRFNFQGTGKLLVEMPTSNSGILDNIDVFLCLDRLAVGNKLYLHTAPHGDDHKQLAKVFETVAKRNNIPFELKIEGEGKTKSSSKVASSGGLHEWQHKLLSKRKSVFAATLSAQEEPNILHSKSSLFDTQALIDEDILVRNIQFLVEVLCRHIYFSGENKSLQEIDDLKLLSEMNAESIAMPTKHWLDYFGRTPRMSPFLHKTDVMERLNEVFSMYGQDVLKHDFKFDTSFTKFYSSDAVTFSAFHVKSFNFDVTLTVIVAGYLLLFHIFLKQPRGLKDLKNALLFQ